MPKIEVPEKLFFELCGRTYTDDEMNDIFPVAKAELDGHEDGTVKIELNDTNRPDLWSVAGVARALKTYETGVVPQYDFFSSKDRTMDSADRVHIDYDSCLGIRDFSISFAAEGCTVTEELLVNLIQSQEKLCQNFGRKRKTIAIGIFRSDRFDSSLIDDMLKAQGDALSAEELANINDGYFSIMLTGLNGDTEYTFVMQVNNGYYTETMTAQYKTDGTFNPGLEYYLYEDFYENSQQPTVEELTGTTWNYYATNLMDDNAKRRKIGQVTMTLDPELSTESESVMRIKGLSGIEFWEGGDLLGTYIPQNSTYSGYTGALSLSANDNYSEGVYNGQTVYPAFLPSDNSGVYFGECMFIGAVADGYLYCIPSPRAQDLGGKSFTYLFTGSTYDLFSLMTEMMLVDPEKDLGGISETAQKNIAAMREKVMNGLQPRNFVELPEFAAQPALSQRERPLPLNAATGRFPVPAPAAKRAQAKFSTGAISSPAAGPEMTFTRIGKKVE